MSNRNEKGTLYLVSTPIGNLEDITLRALRVLKEVDLIACEDTRRTRILLSHYGIKTVMTSLYDEVERKRGVALVEAMLGGKSLAYVSDAGTPLISDPGYHLVRSAIESGIPIVPVPGPSAVITALSVSGMPSDRFAFFGFLPEKRGRRRSFLETLKTLSLTLVFYESPRRLAESLKDIRDILGSREIAVTRELTKVYEEVLRGPVDTLIGSLEKKSIKGEITLLVGGTPGKQEVDDGQIEALFRQMERQEELSTRDLAVQIAEQLDLPKKRVYDFVLRLRATTTEDVEK